MWARWRRNPCRLGGSPTARTKSEATTTVWGAVLSAEDTCTICEGGRPKRDNVSDKMGGKVLCGRIRSPVPPMSTPPCGDTWVYHVVIALKRIAQATALHSQKEIKADHGPE